MWRLVGKSVHNKLCPYEGNICQIEKCVVSERCVVLTILKICYIRKV